MKTARFAPASSQRRFAAIALVAIALLTLSACAPAAPIHHTSAPHHGGSGSSPTPSATPALAPPTVRIPLTCAQLEPAPALNSALHATMTPDDEYPVPDLTKYVAIQDGALNCSWTGPTVGGNQSAYFSVYAMPDAASTWSTYQSQLQDPYPTSYIGAGAHGYCNAESDAPKSISCNLDILVGSVWLEISGYSTAITVVPTNAQVMASFKPLFTTPISALKGVTVTEPAWSDPAATAVTLPTPADQGAVDEAGFAAAIGAPYAIEVSQPQFDLAGGQIAEMLPVNYRQDGGGGAGAGDTVTPAKDFGLTVQILPSGSWAYAQLMSDASSRAGFATISGLGTKAFIYSITGNPDAKNDTALVGIVGEHLYSIEVSDPGTPGTPNTVTMAKAAAGYVVKELTP